MFAVPCPQFRIVCHRAGRDQRVGDFDPMAPPIPVQVDARAMARFLVNRSARERPKKVVQGVMLIWPGSGPQLKPH